MVHFFRLSGLETGWVGGRAALLAEQSRVAAFTRRLDDADQAAEDALAMAERLGLEELRAAISKPAETFRRLLRR